MASVRDSDSADKDFEVEQWKVDLVRSYFNNQKGSGLSESKYKLLVKCCDCETPEKAEENVASAGCEDETDVLAEDVHSSASNSSAVIQATSATRVCSSVISISVNDKTITSSKDLKKNQPSIMVSRLYKKYLAGKPLFPQKPHHGPADRVQGQQDKQDK